MNIFLILALAAGAVALVYALLLALKIGRADAGTARMKEIAASIHQGANAFLFSEYKVLVIFAAVLFLLIGFGLGNWVTAICFIVGALFSTLSGYFGMNVATKANVRTANAAKEGGMNKALSIAFSGGAVMGMSVVASACWESLRFICLQRMSACLQALALAPPPSRCLRASAAVFIPKRRMWAQTWSARWRPGFRRMTRATLL